MDVAAVVTCFIVCGLFNVGLAKGAAAVNKPVEFFCWPLALPLNLGIRLGRLS